jgi:limonene-1,2-epoxide hydrolase
MNNSLRRLTLVAIAMLLVSPAIAAPQQGAVRMSDDPKIAVVEKMIAAWNSRNWPLVAELFAPDGVLHSMMVEPVVGRAAIGARIGHMGEGIEQITLNIRNMGRVGDVVFVERVDEFVFKGHAGRVPVTGVIEVEDGLITEWREYYDRAELLEAMGLKEDFDQAGRN